MSVPENLSAEPWVLPSTAWLEGSPESEGDAAAGASSLQPGKEGQGSSGGVQQLPTDPAHLHYQAIT